MIPLAISFLVIILLKVRSYKKIIKDHREDVRVLLAFWVNDIEFHDELNDCSLCNKLIHFNDFFEDDDNISYNKFINELFRLVQNLKKIIDTKYKDDAANKITDSYENSDGLVEKPASILKNSH